MVDRIEVRGRAVLHVRECPDCDGTKGGIGCEHGGNCPCVGGWFDCERCDGTGEWADPDCDCAACMTVVNEQETKSAA